MLKLKDGKVKLQLVEFLNFNVGACKQQDHKWNKHFGFYNLFSLIDCNHCCFCAKSLCLCMKSLDPNSLSWNRRSKCKKYEQIYTFSLQLGQKTAAKDHMGHQGEVV